MKHKATLITIIVLANFMLALIAQQKGTASFYNKRFDGRRTQNGERLDNKKFTAAHKTYPFGTYVKVTNLKNDNWCIVKVNDRGRFKRGRVIDVTYAAAQELDMIRDGIANVKVEIWPPDSLNPFETIDSTQIEPIKKQGILFKDTLQMEVE